MNSQQKECVNSRTKKQFFYMIFVLIFVEILDTYTTNYPNVIPSKIIEEFLSDYPINVANSILSLCVAIATIGTYFVFFNQYLADRIGRKILLVFTVFGMGFSSLLIFTATNIVQYTIYLFMLYIFFSSDIWVIYINEECPPEKRSFWTNLVLIGGVAGALLIPVFRSIFITETASNWRGMTLFAIFLGIPLSIIIFLTFKETSKFEEIKKSGSIQKEQGNLLKANLKKIFVSKHRREYIALLIMSLLSGLNYIFISLGESLISQSPYLNENDINLIVLVMSGAALLGYIITGLFADKYGRKPLMYLYTIMLPASMIIIAIGLNHPTNALLFVSIGGCMANMSFWGLGVVVRLTTLEILPTEARGTGTGLRSFVSATGMTAGLLMNSLIVINYGLSTSFVIFSVLLLINLPLIRWLLKETKGIDLSAVNIN